MNQVGRRTLRGERDSYAVYELIASGGFASVFFGRSLADNRAVAIKLLHPHLAGSPEAVRKFEAEARLARQLVHPGIVQVLDQGRDGTTPFLVMEWVEGWTLAHLIERRGAFPPDEAAGIACQVLEALAVAHAHGVVHRDVKPLNVMVTAGGRVKLMDFGIAKQTLATVATASSMLVGTPQYMAPEQFRDEPLDVRTDLYALGVTLYQVLVGRVPFEAQSTAGYMYKHLSEAPPPLVELAPRVPPGLAAVVHRALEKEPARRFQRPSEMLAALRPFAGRVSEPSGEPPSTVVLAGPVVGAGRPPATPVAPAAPPAWAPPVGPAAGVPPPPPVAPAGPARPPGPAGAGPPAWLVTTGVAVAVALLLGGGFLALRGQFAPATPTPTAVASSPGPARPSERPTPTSGPGLALGGPTVTPGASPAASPCAAGLQEAAALSGRQAWDQAARRLETLRGAGCDVSEPLYEAWLRQGQALADGERTDEALAAFDRALGVKDGTEARQERSLAQAYRDGRAALARQDWGAAIERLEAVHRANPGYAHGNVVPNLTNAYLGQGDALAAQGKLAEATEAYRQAEWLRPNDPAVTARLRDVAARSAPTPTTAPPPEPPTARADLQALVRRYYDLLDRRQYREAYSFLSRGAQARMSYATYEAQFANSLLRISVRDVAVVDRRPVESLVHAYTTTVSRSGSGQATACWRVDWKLIVEDGQWRREDAPQTQQPCP